MCLKIIPVLLYTYSRLHGKAIHSFECIGSFLQTVLHSDSNRALGLRSDTAPRIPWYSNGETTATFLEHGKNSLGVVIITSAQIQIIEYLI